MHIHILGICGTFMGSLAILAKQLGFEVSGSDANVYPPMSTQLEQQGIRLCEGFDPKHLRPAPDLVIIGNAMSRGNPSVEYVLDRGIRYTSGPEWLAQNVLHGRWVLGVAGTHGKTTTSAMLAWILEYAGMKPGYLIGGVTNNLPASASLGDSIFFVVEADEYDSAFFDKRSKFIHYHPDTFIINNIEFDHADIFSDLSDILKQFHHAVRTVPGEGNILIHADGDNISELLEMGCWSNTHQIGTKETIELDLTNKILNFKEETFKLESLPFYGIHNYQNALMAIYAAFLNGVHPKDSFAALQNFQGVKRRFEKIYEDNNITIIDDFAHHPTAISSTIAAAQDHFDGNILGIIELGSNTMSGGFHGTNLHKSTNSLDKTFWLNLSGSEVEGNEFTSVNDLIHNLKDTLDGFDVILIMSNKDSKKISEPLIELIKKK